MQGGSIHSLPFHWLSFTFHHAHLQFTTKLGHIRSDNKKNKIYILELTKYNSSDKEEKHC